MPPMPSQGQPYANYPPPTMSFKLSQYSGITDLGELARRHRDANQVFIWTLIGGLLCLWPILIISYLEYNKMRAIKEQVASMGVDIAWWSATYRAT